MGSLHGQHEPQGHGHHIGQEMGAKQLEWREAWGFVLFLKQRQKKNQHRKKKKSVLRLFFFPFLSVVVVVHK